MASGDRRREKGYLHGYSATERARLRKQALVLEPMVHDHLPFHRRRRCVEIGSGVGAQTEILLRHFPGLQVTCVERSKVQLAEARKFLRTVPWARGRYALCEADATSLPFERESFDSGFLCWILEHVADPARILSELRRVLLAGAPVVVTEVLNATFFIDPYSPRTLQYWMAFNDHQLELGGDPFVGAKLGNLLQQVGFHDVQTVVKTFHLDNRSPGERADFLAFWTELLLSGAPALLSAGKVKPDVVDGMKEELDRVARDANSVFFYSFIQARARA
ncbi:MAG: methyltransferase domain-containing protein [Planctomycetes bacterium]|nr:methyltransferase domain-containing protein [Planctomycetota bacterium]